MTWPSPEVRQRRVSRIAQRYLERGYSVKVFPVGSDLPEFLSDHRPDIIGTRGEGGIVVEVKWHDELKGDQEMPTLAKVVEERSGWEFEMIVLRPRKAESEKPVPTLGLAQLERNLQQAEELLDQGYVAPAFLVAWASLEGSARRALAHEEKESHTHPPRLISSLVFRGLIDRKDHRWLKDLFDLRSKIVHGLPAEDPSHDDVRRLIWASKEFTAQGELPLEDSSAGGQ